MFEIRAKNRTGVENFVTCMRKALAKKYGDNPVSMGGVFNITRGNAKLHVMVRNSLQLIIVFRGLRTVR